MSATTRKPAPTLKTVQTPERRDAFTSSEVLSQILAKRIPPVTPKVER